MILRGSGGPVKDRPAPLSPKGENLEGFYVERVMCPGTELFLDTFTALGLDWEGEMLTKGSGAGWVDVNPGLEQYKVWGPSEASSEGVPLFLQREVLFLQNSETTPLSCNQ